MADDTSRHPAREAALDAIRAERARQEPCGPPRTRTARVTAQSADVPLFVKLAVISEELRRARPCAVLDALFLAALAGGAARWPAPPSTARLRIMRTELVQVAAVAVAILEGLG